MGPISGDPIKFHAAFIVICKQSKETFPAKDLVSYGRVGTSTKKTVVIATKHPAEDGAESRVSYQSLQFMDTYEANPSTSKGWSVFLQPITSDQYFFDNTLLLLQ